MAPDRLEFENQMALALVQSLLGSIGSEFRAVAFEVDVDDRTVDLHVALKSPVDDIDDVIYDIEASMAGLTDGSVLLRTHIWVGDNWRDNWPAGDLPRRIFGSKVDD